MKVTMFQLGRLLLAFSHKLLTTNEFYNLTGIEPQEAARIAPQRA